nr:hypothetical protein [uncultured Pseudodesulfovibrio sp.]
MTSDDSELMEFSVSIESDEDGYIGRECPECEKYFKVKNGTGLLDATDCHCPYCNNVDPHDHYWTQQQIEYAQSVALNQISGELLGQLKKLERKPDRNAFISIGITVEGSPTPIVHYTEEELEERVTCAGCTLEYTIYGAFGYCPDCGVHNSSQIVNANFDLALKIVELASQAEDDVQSKLIENALEDAVSAFDGFGREHCSAAAPKVSFQNISAAKDKLASKLGVDISDGVASDQWDFLCEQFQKRHLLAHRMGIVDEEFICKTGCSPELEGRKVPISVDDVKTSIQLLKIVVNNIFTSISK